MVGEGNADGSENEEGDAVQALQGAMAVPFQLFKGLSMAVMGHLFAPSPPELLLRLQVGGIG